MATDLGGRGLAMRMMLSPDSSRDFVLSVGLEDDDARDLRLERERRYSMALEDECSREASRAWESLTSGDRESRVSLRRGRARAVKSGVATGASVSIRASKFPTAAGLSGQRRTGSSPMPLGTRRTPRRFSRTATNMNG